jgi:hypothetical protein
MPSSAVETTSEGAPRIVEVMGPTITVGKYGIALPRVSTTALASRRSGGEADEKELLVEDNLNYFYMLIILHT